MDRWTIAELNLSINNHMQLSANPTQTRQLRAQSHLDEWENSLAGRLDERDGFEGLSISFVSGTHSSSIP